MAKVATAQVSRKARFKAALAVTQTTAKGWAEAHSVTEGHLHAVLNGRQSERLMSEIESFIQKHLPEQAA